MTDKEWARMCIRCGWKVLAALTGVFIGLALVRWMGW